MFNKKRLLKQAKGLRRTIVFPEAGFSDRTLEAAKILKKKKIVDVLLVGDDSALVLRDKSLSNFNIANPKTSPLKDKLVKLLLAKRKEKGLTRQEAEELVLDPYYFATLLVELGVADGMVSGAESPTAQTVRPALQVIGSAKKSALVSSCMLMFGKNKFLKDKTLLIGDCGIIPDPTSEDLVSIANQTVETYNQLGLKEPKLAFLSYSSKNSANGLLVEKVSKAAKEFKRKDVLFDGELQFDAAMVPKIAEHKAPESQIKGDANILIFPDLNSGNICYKTMQYIGGLNAIGPILQGLKKPVNDLSRGCSVDDIILISAITALQSVRKEKNKWKF